MAQALIEALQRHSQTHVRRDGLARTGISGLYTLRISRTGDLPGAPRFPLMCFVGQGAKQVSSEKRERVLEAGHSMLVTPSDAACARVVGASRAAPYLALAFRPDPQIVAELWAEMQAAPGDLSSQADAQSAEREAAETAARMVRLLDHPSSLAVLQQPLRRELHYWLLAGRYGHQIRRAVATTRYADRIARAVELIRREYRSTLTSERLAATAGLGLSVFYQCFREATSASPLQYQKQLRLAEARRLLIAKPVSASEAAFAVGYESVSQFVREYRRTFGLPPAQDAAQSRAHVQQASRSSPPAQL
jgi:AraC-like DNA-binding protein